METWAWIILIIGIIVVFGIASVVVCLRRKSNCGYCEYWIQGWSKIKPCWYKGLILDVSIVAFWFLSKFSINEIVGFCLRRHKVRTSRQYWVVDLIIFFYTLVELIIFFIFLRNPTNVCWVLVAFIIYRLFDIFQVWVRHFIISSEWNPISSYRTLLLVFIGYLEIIILYGLLVYIFRNQFEGISYMNQAIYYSIRNAVTIGSSEVVPASCYGYAIFSTQFMFVLLFLTSVVSRVLGHR